MMSRVSIELCFDDEVVTFVDFDFVLVFAFMNIAIVLLYFLSQLLQ